MISYSRKAITALTYLFRPYNDIDIFVEDTACRNLYDILVNRILGGRAKVERIFQLGGRDIVIEECRKNQDKNSRNVLYLIDGDFDVLVGSEKIELDNFYQLSVYCSENLILTEESVFEIAKESLPNSTREEINACVNYIDFLEEVVNKLRPLFSVYAVAFTLDAGLETSGYNVSRFLVRLSGKSCLSQQLIDDRIRFLLSELKNVYGNEIVDSALLEVQELFKNDTVEDARYISGKSYILPLVYHYLHDNSSFSGTLDQLKVRLSRYCNLNVDTGLVQAILDASKGLI